MSVTRLRSIRSSGHRSAGGPSTTQPTLTHPAVAVPLRDAHAQFHADVAHLGSGSGSGDLEPRFNQRTSGAQRALEFLDQLEAGLRSLRASLRRRLESLHDGMRAGGTETAEINDLDTQIQRVSACWSRRPTLGAGTLNGRLVYSAEAAARQNFTVRGLDFGSLRAEAAVEILNLSVGVRGHRAGSSVAVDPSVSNETLVYRFDRALAQSGIRASVGTRNALTFNAQESVWPLVRDTFMVMGEGRRFSTGRFGRVHVIPEPAVLQPEVWSCKDISSMRAMRLEIFNAQAEVRRAHRIVAEDLADAGSKVLSIARGGESDWCAEFAGMFEMSAQNSSYGALTAVFPAVVGISRERVMTALSESVEE